MAFSARTMFFTLEWLLLLNERCTPFAKSDILNKQRTTYVFNVCGCLRRVGHAKQMSHAKWVGCTDWRVVHTDTHNLSYYLITKLFYFYLLSILKLIFFVLNIF